MDTQTKTRLRKIFAARLRQAMLLRNLTQAELAADIDIPQTSISHLACGDHGPNCYTVWALSKGLDVTTDYLLGLSDNLNSSTPKDLELHKAIDNLSLHDKRVLLEFVKTLARAKLTILEEKET